MTPQTPDETHPARQFSVHVHHEHRHPQLVEEKSFEAAAVAFVEEHPLSIGGGAEISVVVREMESGHERCFRIDLETGATAPCA